MAVRKKPAKKPVRKKPKLPLADGIPVHCAHDKIVARAELIPNPRNPNQHPEIQVDILATIIKAQGWRAPITVSLRSGLMVRGHGRLLSAERMGVDEVPVDYQNYDTDAEELADLLADNKIPELSALDIPQTAAILAELNDVLLDIEITGFDEEKFRELAAWQPDDSHLPDPLPPPPVAGDDNRSGRILLVYETPEERERWFDLLGIEGSSAQVVFSLADIAGQP